MVVRKGVGVFLQNVWSCENAEFGRTYNSEKVHHSIAW
jgi:hypothetical protein